MKYVLVMLAFSYWNHEFIARTEIGEYSDRATCEEAAQKENSWQTQYFCVEKKP